MYIYKIINKLYNAAIICGIIIIISCIIHQIEFKISHFIQFLKMRIIQRLYYCILLE